ncbi:MAG TPA: cupin domain-containing protein [Burkholderiales bacterium]|nr:cupin domain-containing protein [Burkholderiales bacterium]
MKLLGGLAPRTFLQRHWQKRPLLVRGALPGVDLLDHRALAALARRDDVESRIVKRVGAKWVTAHGPFSREVTLRRRSTLLVSGVNLHLADADALLRRFSFVPQARLDDLMVSYATAGGGVGPHVDSYDVFLLQGPGRRTWRVWFEGKILKYTVQPGDLLYLPPGLKHDGVALEPCYTYSIGFRTPRGAELGAAFLDWLHERGLPDARYRDPGLSPARHAGRIPAGMTLFAQNFLRRIRWSAKEAGMFLGEYLSAPKPHVVFHPTKASRPLARSRVVLDPKTQLLYSGNRFFINGESLLVASRSAKPLRNLADKRSGPGTALRALAALIAQWHRAGYLHLEKAK